MTGNTDQNKGKAQEEKDKLPLYTASAISSFRVLFQDPTDTGLMAITRSTHREFLQTYLDMLKAMHQEIVTNAKQTGDGQENKQPNIADNRLYISIDERSDFIDYYNQLVSLADGSDISQLLSGCIWDSIGSTLPRKIHERDHTTTIQHIARHANWLLQLGILVPEKYSAQLREAIVDTQLPVRIDPTTLGTIQKPEVLQRFLTGNIDESGRDELVRLIRQNDSFSHGQVYESHNGRITQSDIGNLTPLGMFYGYQKEKGFFDNTLWEFTDNKLAQPVIITGFQGFGKTHFIHAYGTEYAGLTMIRAGNTELDQHFPGLIDELTNRYHYRRFMLFFDDVKPHLVNWEYFKPLVDGQQPFPENVMIVMASNYEFPPPITSRAKNMTFGPMTAKLCYQMIEDYLHKNGMKTLEEEAELSGVEPDIIKKRRRHGICAIVNNYVIEYKRGAYSELTGRSLASYLDTFNDNVAKLKSLMTTGMSREVQLTDEEVFKKVAEEMEADFKRQKEML